MINVVILSGRLVDDVEKFETESGTVISHIRLASDYGFNAETGEAKTLFINCKAIDNKAMDYLKKGDKVTITGKLTSREYTAKDGTNRTVFEVMISSLDLPARSAEDFNPQEEQEEKTVALTDVVNSNGKRTSGIITNKNENSKVVVKSYKTR